MELLIKKCVSILVRNFRDVTCVISVNYLIFWDLGFLGINDHGRSLWTQGIRGITHSHSQRRRSLVFQRHFYQRLTRFIRLHKRIFRDF